MTIWLPDISGAAGSKAAAIADALARDIASGRLAAGAKLPPHRELAYHLNVSVGTVTRSYAEARRRGLVTPQVGSGTFVCGGAPEEQRFAMLGEEPAGLIDLSANLAWSDLRQITLDEALGRLSGLAGSAELLEYQAAQGMRRHREAGARWLSVNGFGPDPGRIVVCQGTQQGLALALPMLARPGETVLAETLTFPPVKSLARMFDFRLHGVEIDTYGLVPDALDAACRATGAKVLYTIPTLHNPTGATLPEDRRIAIARIARAYDLQIVEDDVLAKLPENRPPPIAAFAPERTWYVTSVSKCLAPGLRIGYLHCPTDDVEPVSWRVRALGWMSPPLTAEIATGWIADGTAERLVAWHRHENAARAALAGDVLGGGTGPADACPHLWLQTTEPWRGRELADEIRRRGVLVAEGGAFAVGRGPHRHAIRISLNAARSRDQLRRALRIIAGCLADRPGGADTCII